MSPSLPANHPQTFYLIVLGNLVVVALVGLFVLRPVFGLLASHTRQIAQAHAATTALEQQVQTLRQLKQTYPTYETQYAPLLADLPKTRDTAGYQTELEDLATLTSVSLQVVNTGNQAQPGTTTQTAAATAGGFPVIPVKVQLSGSFAAVTDFIHRIETMDRFSRLTGLDLKGNPATGEVKATVDLQTLYFPNG